MGHMTIDLQPQSPKLVLSALTCTPETEQITEQDRSSELLGLLSSSWPAD